MRQATKQLILAATIMVTGTLAHASWGAVAFSKTSGNAKISHEAENQADAESVAKEACGADCAVVLAGEYKYLALSVSTDGHFGVAGDDDQQTAMRSSYQECLKHAPACHWRTWAQNTGNQETDGANEFMPGPTMHPNLKAIGGAFSHTIDNFKGFKQKDSNLCWAAALKTMYFSMTGWDLSEWRLARLMTQQGEVPRDNAAQSQISVSVSDDNCNLATKENCNHGNSLLAVARYLGLETDLVNVPSNNNSVAIYRQIRESLMQDRPVAITIDWFTGQTHELVVRGATFAPKEGSKTGEAEIQLRVYDPEDDSYSIMTSDAYLPAYEDIPGRFTGNVVIPTHYGPASTPVPSVMCPFFNNDGQEHFNCN